MTKKEPDLRWQAILRFVYITTSKRADNGADKIYLPFWKTRYVDVIKTKQKQLLHLFHISVRDNGGIRQAQPKVNPILSFQSRISSKIDHHLPQQHPILQQLHQNSQQHQNR